MLADENLFYQVREFTSVFPLVIQATFPVWLMVLSILLHQHWVHIQQQFLLHIYRILPSQDGDWNGNPLQYSCLEDPMDRGAWRATVHGVAKSQTRWANNTTLPYPHKNAQVLRFTKGSTGCGQNILGLPHSNIWYGFTFSSTEEANMHWHALMITKRITWWRSTYYPHLIKDEFESKVKLNNGTKVTQLVSLRASNLTQVHLIRKVKS